VVFVAVVFIAVDSEIIHVAVVVVVFLAVAVVVADKFSADAEVLPLHVVGAPGIETPRRRSGGSRKKAW